MPDDFRSRLSSQSPVEPPSKRSRLGLNASNWVICPLCAFPCARIFFDAVDIYLKNTAIGKVLCIFCKFYACYGIFFWWMAVAVDRSEDDVHANIFLWELCKFRDFAVEK